MAVLNLGHGVALRSRTRAGQKGGYLRMETTAFRGKGKGKVEAQTLTPIKTGKTSPRNSRSSAAACLVIPWGAEGGGSGGIRIRALLYLQHWGR